MAIYDILCGLKDTRENKEGKCTFNGYLEDYLSLIETEETKQSLHAILSAVLEMDDHLKIIVDLGLNINAEAIANQIIRYKDAFKLPANTIHCPYVIYGSFDNYQKAIILTLGDQREYIMAKAMYYVMSEPENEFEGTRNEVIAFSVEEQSIERMKKACNDFFILNKKAGIVQRDLDAIVFHNYEEMYVLANQIAQDQHDQLQDILQTSEEKDKAINTVIANWYLMKKFTYVQYMMDKNTLHKLHDGNIKKQRHMAKQKCDAINFVSFAEMWKMVKNLE